MLDNVWVGPKEAVAESAGQTFFGYAGPWLASVVQKPLPKLGLGALLAAVAHAQEAFGTALFFVMMAWFIDFAVGVLRAIVDPEVELQLARARNGVMKGLVIPLLVIMAALIEGMTLLTIGWDPGGKLILAVCVALFWEEALSIQKNGRHFFRALNFRLNLPAWIGKGDDDS